MYWQAIRKQWLYSMAGDNELPLISQGIKTSVPISFPRQLRRSFLEGILGDPGAVSRAGRKGSTKVFKHRRKSPWVPTLTGPFPNGQANAGSWLGTKKALYYCAQSANSISWVLLVNSYTTAIDSITACLAHTPKKCTLQSGNFQFDINSPASFQNTVYPKTKDAFPKIQAWQVFTLSSITP